MEIPPNEDNQLAIVEEQEVPTKRRKKKSIVWEHFTIETVGPGCRRASCNQCNQSFAYSTGSKVAGTSHLKRHIAKGACAVFLRNQENNNNQLTPFTPKNGTNSSVTPTQRRRYRSSAPQSVVYDQFRCRHEVANMIIMHDYPLHIVEQPGFVAFVRNLQPQFDLMSFNMVQGDCVATYLREKLNLSKIIDSIPGRICLTLDLWNSSRTIGYVFLTGHYIDSNWKMQKRILNVVMEPYIDSDTTAFSHAVSACLSDWNLENKVFSITLNHPLNDTGIESLRALLSIKNPLILNGQFLLPSCIARTLSSMAKDILEAGEETVKKIRDSVKYVKKNELHEGKFLELKQQLQVPTEKTLFLDNQTEWKATYLMLIAASDLKEVFSCLDTFDPDYKLAPSLEDWEKAETLCAYLKLLYDTANILTSPTNPTTNVFFHEVWKIWLELARAATSEDSFISNLTKKIQEKFSKYWDDCSLVLGVAVVMDPRFKMRLVEFSFSRVYGDDASTFIKIVNDGIHKLFNEYLALPLEDGENFLTGSTHLSNGLTDFYEYVKETTSQQARSELDQYLDESLLPRAQDFDVLGWWKVNKLKYPILSKMARDILSIPLSTLPSDSVFDLVAKEMDPYRCSLRPETLEAIICAKDWIQQKEPENQIVPVKVEFQV